MVNALSSAVSPFDGFHVVSTCNVDEFVVGLVSMTSRHWINSLMIYALDKLFDDL